MFLKLLVIALSIARIGPDLNTLSRYLHLILTYFHHILTGLQPGASVVHYARNRFNGFMIGFASMNGLKSGENEKARVNRGICFRKNFVDTDPTWAYDAARFSSIRSPILSLLAIHS